MDLLGRTHRCQTRGRFADGSRPNQRGCGYRPGNRALQTHPGHQSGYGRSAQPVATVVGHRDWRNEPWIMAPTLRSMRMRDPVCTPQWKPEFHRLRLEGRQLTPFPTFSGDARTIEIATAMKNPRGRVLRGTIGSAFQYNRELDMIASIHARYGTDSEDMESAFAHGAAIGLGTRFLAIRMISDSEYNHPKFERVAGQYCGEFVVELVRRLPKRL